MVMQDARQFCMPGSGLVSALLQLLQPLGVAGAGLVELVAPPHGIEQSAVFG